MAAIVMDRSLHVKHISKRDASKVTSFTTSAAPISSLDLLGRHLFPVCLWLLGLLTLVTFDLSGCRADTEALKNLTIGVMISSTGPKRLGQEAIAAINLSIQNIQESPEFALVREKGYQFRVYMDDVPCYPTNAFSEMMDIFTGAGEHKFVQNAFVGPSCDEVCQPGGRLAKYFNVLMISYGCESSIFDDKEEYPTFGRTTPTFKDMEVFFAEVIHHFRWPRVTLVTIATPVWQETTTEFAEQIELMGVRVQRWSLDSVESIGNSDFLVKLAEEAAQTRVYIILMYSEGVVSFMQEAERANLTTVQAGNVFMVVDFAGSHNRLDQEDGVSLTSLEGLLDVTYDVQPQRDGFQAFLSQILNISEITVSPSCSNYEYGIHPLLVSDGIYVIAGTFNSSLAMNISLEEGAAMANFTHDATFQGLYHTIEMDEKGTRRPRFMLHNIQKGCYTPIARTAPDGSGLVFISTNIVWPGGGNATPIGQPECGWLGELCPSQSDQTALVMGVGVGSSVFVLLITVIIVIIYMWRRNVKQSRLLATDWLMEWEDLEPRLYYPSLAASHPAIGTSRPMGMKGGSLESLSTLKSEGSDNLTTGSGREDGIGGAQSAAPTTTTISGGQSFRCPVVRMDVEGIWAIKFIRKPVVTLTEAVKKELNLVRSLKHQNVNPFIGACLKPGHVSVMWSYNPKGSLLDLIHSGIFKMDLMFQLSFAQDIIKGLAYIHKSDLSCHGRLKSTNIVVDAGLTCKLTDVHMPRVREGEQDLPEDDPNYWFQHVWSAPEVLRATSAIDVQKADIYAYGIVLYEIMLRRKPYVTENSMRTLLEPQWQSVIECVREPGKLTQYLDLSAADDIMEETEERADTCNTGSSLTPAQSGARGPDFSGAWSNKSQATPSPTRCSKHQERRQRIFYWKSFLHHYQRNKQNVLSSRMQNRTPTEPNTLIQHQADRKDPTRAKSASFVLAVETTDMANKLPITRTMSVTPALLHERYQNSFYETSRRTSYDSALHHHHPQSSPPVPPAETTLMKTNESATMFQTAPAPLGQNIVPSPTPGEALPNHRENAMSSTQMALSASSAHRKQSSCSGQRKLSRVSPCPTEEAHPAAAQPDTGAQNSSEIFVDLRDRSSLTLRTQDVAALRENHQDSGGGASNDTLAHANDTKDMAVVTNQLSVAGQHIAEQHQQQQQQQHGAFTNVSILRSASQNSESLEVSEPEVDLPPETTKQPSGQPARVGNPRGEHISNLDISPVSQRSQGNANGLRERKEEVFPKTDPVSTGEHKLLPMRLAYPVSPITVSVASPEQQQQHYLRKLSCPPCSPSGSPTCCCPRIMKRHSVGSWKKPPTLTHDLHLNAMPAETLTRRHGHYGGGDKPPKNGADANSMLAACSQSVADSRAATPLAFSPTFSRPSTGWAHPAADKDADNVLMRPEIPCWFRGASHRAGSAAVNRSRAMSVDRSRANLNVSGAWEGRGSALDIFSRSSFYNRRGLGGGKVSNGDKEAQMLELMKLCWSEDPEHRPDADVIIKKLRGLTSGRSLSDNIEKIVSRYSEQLEDTVNERTRRLEEEKAKYFRVLCEVIPQKYVSALVSGGKVEAESFSNVTIFFSDIVGFTSICGKCSPQEVLDFLNDLYTRFDVILNSYKVYKVETIGDAYMVAGGIPEPIPDHAQQIAFLALHLLSVSTSVMAPYVTHDGLRTQRILRLRIGLNSGPVVAGIVGEKMPRYCLYGNTVNIASRMESNGKPLRVHMSRETTQELEAIGGFDISYRGMISVKGKDIPVPTYWLNNSLTQPFDLPDWTLADEAD